MEDVKSLSNTSSATTRSHETHSSTPTLCEDTSSFNSLKSNAATKTSPSNYSVSYHFITSINTPTPQISCLAIQNNNLYAASNREINVFDSTTLSLVDTFGSGSSSGRVKSIAFSGGKVFTAHQDCKIRVWRKKVTTTMSSSSIRQTKHELIQTLPTFKDRFFNCMLPKNYVKIRRHKQKLWIEHADAVSGLAVIGNNDVGFMYSVSWDKSFKIWNISSDNMRCLDSVEAHSDAVNAVAVDPTTRTIYTGSADGEIKVWMISEETKKHKLLTTLTKHASSVNALALTTNGTILCSGGGDRVILVWERKNNNYSNNNSSGDENGDLFVTGCSLRGHNGAILCLVCVNIDGVVISGSSDRSVRIWKYGKGFGGCCLAVLEGHCKPVKSLVVIPGGGELLDDGLSVFSGSLDGEIRAWKLVVVSDDTDY